jgi:hypothetical protein
MFIAAPYHQKTAKRGISRPTSDSGLVSIHSQRARYKITHVRAVSDWVLTAPRKPQRVMACAASPRGILVGVPDHGGPRPASDSIHESLFP